MGLSCCHEIVLVLTADLVHVHTTLSITVLTTFLEVLKRLPDCMRR